MTGPRRPLHADRPEVGDLPIGEDVRKELDFHIAMRAEELVGEGWAPEAARAEAERIFGNLSRVREECADITEATDRSRRRANRWDGFRQDLRFAARTLRRSPVFAAVAVATLALGMGANTAIFSVVNSVLLRPLPYPAPDQLVWVAEWQHERNRGMGVAWANYVDWREQNRSFDGIAVFGAGTTTLLGGERPLRTTVGTVSEDFWTVFPVRLVTGRLFLPEEHADPARGAAILREDLWTASFGARPISELRIEVEGESVPVVGVVPSEFDYPSGSSVWVVARPTSSSRTAHNWRAVARLRTDVEMDVAEGELDALQGRLAAETAADPDFLADGVRLTKLRERIAGPARPALYTLLVAAGLVLLVACTNLASTLLARGAARTREIAVRSSLGAERGRLVRQLLTESALLSALGAVGGLALALLLLRVIVAAAPSSVPRIDEIGIDTAALLFTLGAAAATTLLFGLVPALRASALDSAVALRAGGRGSSDGQAFIWRALVVAEVALAFVLLAGSGLLVRSFNSVMSVEGGFRPEGVMTTQVDLSMVKYPDGQAHARFYDQLVDQLEAQPGITRAGVASTLPVSGFSMPNGRVELDGDLEKRAVGGYAAVSAGYFEALGIPLVQGRHFARTDGPDSEHVAIVSRAFAERYWPGENPIGRQVTGGGMDEFWRDRPFAAVVGVVGDVHYRALTDEAEPVVYFPHSQRPGRLRFSANLVTLEATAGSASSAVREQVQRLDSDVPLELRTMGERIAGSVSERRFTMSLLIGFGVVALLLASIGIYGVVSYSVERRTREMGVRLALGARPEDVSRLVVGGALKPVVLGAVVGVVAGLALSTVIESLLFNVSPNDPATFSVVAFLLLAAGGAASVIPARRSTRVDPMITMQAD